MRGAVELLESTGANPESEIDKVTTPGGLTIRGLNAMEEVDSRGRNQGPASIGKTLTAIWGVNKVILLGNVGVDPTIRYVETRPVATFTLATTERALYQRIGRTDSGAHRVAPDCHVGRRCRDRRKYIRKGTRLYIEGKLRTRVWEDRNTIKRNVTEIIVDTFEILAPPRQ